MPSPPPLVLDARKQTLFECGAALLALLAFPSATDTEREEIAASLCASHLQAMFEKSGNPNERVKAKYAFRGEQTIKRDLKTIDRRIRDRMVAAKVAIAFDHNKGVCGGSSLRGKVFIKRHPDAFRSGKFLCLD